MTKLLTNARIVTMAGSDGYGIIDDGAIQINGERIAWIGTADRIPSAPGDNVDVHDCNGGLVTPGLIDCHTHTVYASDRANEFSLRLEGASYEEIAASGGGIISTVNAVRQASLEDLIAQSLPRVLQMRNAGVTTLEIKSGYGLDTRHEIKMLEAAERVGQLSGIQISKTFLGAHAVPAEFCDRKDDYIDRVCQEMLPEAHARGLVDSVDGFAEGIAFSVSQIEKVFDVARGFGLPVKLHAEQLSNLRGAAMAAAHGALSVDHLEYLDPADVPALSKAGTVAVMLPGAFYFLGETKRPPVQALREHDVAIAVATDCNPGSSPLHSLLLAMNMACTLFGMTPEEALRGTTINAARALGMEKTIGSIEVGKRADLAVWDADNPALLSYNIGFNPCRRVMLEGTWITTDH